MCRCKNNSVKIHAFQEKILKLDVVEGFAVTVLVACDVVLSFFPLVPELYYFVLNEFAAFHTTIHQSYYK